MITSESEWKKNLFRTPINVRKILVFESLILKVFVVLTRICQLR